MMSQKQQIIQEHIQIEAYLLSERAGHPVGMDEFFWMQAEAIVHGRAAVVAPAGKAKPAKRSVTIKRTLTAKAKQTETKPATKRKK